MHNDTVCIHCCSLPTDTPKATVQNVLHKWLWWHVHNIQISHNNKFDKPPKEAEYADLKLNKIDENANIAI
jgi:hypothetical protein